MIAIILSRTKPAIRIKARSFHLTLLVLSKHLIFTRVYFLLRCIRDATFTNLIRYNIDNNIYQTYEVTKKALIQD